MRAHLVRRARPHPPRDLHHVLPAVALDPLDEALVLLGRPVADPTCCAFATLALHGLLERLPRLALGALALHALLLGHLVRASRLRLRAAPFDAVAVVRPLGDDRLEALLLQQRAMRARLSAIFTRLSLRCSNVRSARRMPCATFSVSSRSMSGPFAASYFCSLALRFCSRLCHAL